MDRGLHDAFIPSLRAGPLAERPPPPREGFVPIRERLFRRFLGQVLADCGSVLDVGCGRVTPLSRIDRHFAFAVGVDVARAEIAAARRLGFHDALVRADLASIQAVFSAKSFDAVVALDVIEHLPRDGAERALLAFERIARRKVVVFTPNGFVPQAGTPDNPFQEHRSGFSVDDLRERGYAVRGFYGLRALVGPYGEVVPRPRLFWRRVNDVASLFVVRRPELAFSLLAEKVIR